MSDSSNALPVNDQIWSPRRGLAWLGRLVRARLHFVLALMALAAGIAWESLFPRAWRRSVRMEFRRVLRAALLGSLPATIFVAALMGFGMVYQAMYWLQLAGQENLLGTILVTILLREVAPLLVGVVLLGRSGAAMLTELGQLQAERQIHALQAQGVDPFSLLALPRGVAFALAAYTLGIVFILVTLAVGFAVGSLFGVVQDSIWSFLDTVLRAARPTDFVVFPVKMLAIGLLVAATACLTALSASPDDDIGHLISRGFIRGILAVMLTSGLLSLAI
ncbi:MAG TPA: ABC transporter permease [Dongiaceae bacterium]|nr:ABC transporter permease [Dongiaceae bacterium]